MGRKRQDEIQLVVGNKHLLFLFFTAAVFFSLFFFWGYTIGYGQGERAGPTQSAALSETSDPDKGILPRTLFEDPPKVEVAAEPEIEPKPAAAKVAPAKPAAVKSAAKPKPPPPKPAARKPTPKAAGKGLHLQVAALRMGKDAQALASRLKQRGYAAAVYRAPGNDWFRVVVGPFGSDQAAEAARRKLGKDGFEAMTRRF